MRIVRISLATLALLWAGAAAAADMTGRYIGTGEAEGTTIDLVQTGTDLGGVLGGEDAGTLTGVTDGDVTATGIVLIAGIAKVAFELTWAPEGLTVVVIDTTGRGEPVFFAREGGVAATPILPPSVAGGGQYYVWVDGEPVGPMTLLDLVDRIDDGITQLQDYVWTPGRVGWAPAEAFPEIVEAAAAPDPALPIPTKPGPTPGPVTLPAPDPVGPAMTDDEANAALRDLLVALVADDELGVPEANRAIAVTCMLDAVMPLPTEERIALLGANFVPDDAMIVRFEAAVPGINERVEACGEVALGPPQTAVLLEGVGLVTVIGGTNQAAEPIERGYRFVIDGLVVTVVPGLLTIGTATAALPAQTGDLVVTFEGETVVVTFDGAELTLQ